MTSSWQQRRLALLAALSLIGVFFTVTVVLVGAWTRLVDAGLGCPDWPGCYGELVVPDAERALIHSPDAPLENFKAWVEMTHRYLASSLGLLVIALLLLGARLRGVAGYPWCVSLALLGMILIQGAFGAFTVTLKLWPQVVTLHLLGGLSVMLLFLWLHLRLRRLARGEQPMVRPRRLSPLWVAAVLLLFLQLALGGWVSSNYAGIACQGFPACNGQWWPDTDWSEGFHLTQTVGPSYLHGQLHAEARTAIQIGHRVGAGVLGLALLILAWRHWQEPRLRPWLGAMLGGYAMQFFLGVANVLLWLPLWLALAHTAGAVLLVILMTLAVWHWRQPVREPNRHLQAEKEWVHA
ncbi:COX15/CtaA family protein [Halomonas sp. TRM85114]|uniref:COX15/CtaA family protein n=1 Tax=Halomonas jincaotanensis TaxID=2810616 RepID=UPI001BD5406F|nr:COX15/CtaA family protein [Halomonas jincaotanensis]MBS9405569.1 COX15/CtaA family protein [Halomonas jincaotanensis]